MQLHMNEKPHLDPVKSNTPFRMLCIKNRNLFYVWNILEPVE